MGIQKYWEIVDKHNELSADFKEFIMRFFTFEGKDRITLEEIKNHPWYTKVGLSDSKIKKEIVRKYEKNSGKVGAFYLEPSRSESSTDRSTQSDFSEQRMFE